MNSPTNTHDGSRDLWISTNGPCCWEKSKRTQDRTKSVEQTEILIFCGHTWWWLLISWGSRRVRWQSSLLCVSSQSILRWALDSIPLSACRWMNWILRWQVDSLGFAPVVPRIFALDRQRCNLYSCYSIHSRNSELGQALAPLHLSVIH